MRLPDKRPLVMGIVNVTPDSFSGDGVDGTRAVAQGLQMLGDGADILDVGGESTRPGAHRVTEQEELERVIPVIEGLHREGSGLISIDTMRARVAEAAIVAGAHMINDVTGGQGDPAMLPLAARLGCPIVLMHNRASWRKIVGQSYEAPVYKDFMGEMLADLQALRDNALKTGVRAESIILDPGLGFGKNAGQNAQLIRDLASFKALGCTLLLAPSRKSFIGDILNLPVSERLEGTASCVAIGIVNGAGIVRVHDVKQMRRVADMAAAIAQ